MTIILGAGLAGLSASYHLNHDCEIYEKQEHCGGHIFSHQINGFTWDEGPHVSFTKYDYVKELFAASVEGDYLEYHMHPTNYYKGSWVPHPAQTNLFAVPEPMRSLVLESFLSSRSEEPDRKPANYQEWLELAFGSVFANEFPRAYTVKYWTTEPSNMSTDWVGERVLYPQVEDVKAGTIKAPERSKNYLTVARYPAKGGYFSYANKLKKGAKINYRKKVVHIDLQNKEVSFEDGTKVAYTRLINTLPLTEFIKLSTAPKEIKAAAEQLSCSDLVLINVIASHVAPIKNQWLYVYDMEKYSTRINFAESFSPANGTPGKTGIQVEVYFSKYREQTESLPVIIDKVCNELVEMGLLKDRAHIEEISTRRVKYANVIFDLPREESLNKVYDYLTTCGLVREEDDLAPMTNWHHKLENGKKLGSLIMAGRYGEWKYYWTDDCVMRGLHISKSI